MEEKPTLPRHGAARPQEREPAKPVQETRVPSRAASGGVDTALGMPTRCPCPFCLQRRGDRATRAEWDRQEALDPCFLQLHVGTGGAASRAASWAQAELSVNGEGARSFVLKEVEEKEDTGEPRIGILIFL